ncbi:HIT family protein [Paludisphaera borealis]|uniref:AP-4-A phosphorylase n=1 Tax=Paludisphaera borealis TaxID=1387353 RepID=A0A1U7CMX4_9BACT|nr:HIT domain-containing protein [Paludisphaera borealis]APW60233.1 AP-4-A phosphorylase [Paludisphaera borealis]
MLDRIWAPWRAHYVAGAVRNPTSESSCFLCDGLAKDDDRENLIVWRGPNSVVVLNRYPYNNGHLLIAPRVHRGSLHELDGPDLVEPIQTVRWMMTILDRMLRPQGYNVGLNQGGAAGAGLPGHLHWHLVPRWDGDTNFMPILAQAKVVTESLDAFHDRLRQEIAADLEVGLHAGFINSSGNLSKPS